MISNISITGRVELGEFPIFVENCLHQPIASFEIPTAAPLGNIIENTEILDYQICPPYPNSLPTDISNPVRRDITEWTSIYAYILFDAYDYSNTSQGFNRYHASPDRYVYAVDSSPNITALSVITVYKGVDHALYRYTQIAKFESKVKYYQLKTVSTNKALIEKPNYMSLVNGYEHDDRTLPADYPVIIPVKTETVKIRYYRKNLLESIPDLTSIDWRVHKCNLTEGIEFKLPLENCVLGTLKCESSELMLALSSAPSSINKYPYSSLLEAAIPGLFQEWNAVYNSIVSGAIQAPDTSIFSSVTKKSATTEEEINPILHVLSANNNVWNNRPTPTPGLNFNASHPMFIVDEQRAYDWHVAPQTEGVGTLIMDSPRVIELHKALQAQNYLIESGNNVPTDSHHLDWYIKNQSPQDNQKVNEIHTALNISNYLLEEPAVVGTGTIQLPETPAKHKLDWYIRYNPRIFQIWKTLGGDKFTTNDIDPDRERVTNLVWYVENIARVLGLRFNANGLIDSDKEEKLYKREVVDDPQYDKNGYSKNSFGRYGRLTPNLTNSFGAKAFDKVADIPQLLEALFEHLNRSIGIQQGTEIKVINSVTGKEDYYPNQLAMLLDIHAKITEIQLNSKQSFNLVFTIAHELRELWSGVGIPMAYKDLWTRYGKLQSIGFQSDKGSILTHINTLKINIGILVGNFISRPKDKRNPLERIFSRKEK